MTRTTYITTEGKWYNMATATEQQKADPAANGAASDDIVGRLFEQAHVLKAQYQRVVDTQRKVRDSLRNLAGADVLTAEQKAEVEKLFPVRVKLTPEQKAEKAAKAEAAKAEKAAKAAK